MDARTRRAGALAGSHPGHGGDDRPGERSPGLPGRPALALIASWVLTAGIAGQSEEDCYKLLRTAQRQKEEHRWDEALETIHTVLVQAPSERVTCFATGELGSVYLELGLTDVAAHCL